MAYHQAQQRKKALKKTYTQILGRKRHVAPSGVWINEDRGFLYRYSASNTPGYTKLLRRIGNKKVRQSKHTLKHGDYRRVYDYKWALF